MKMNDRLLTEEMFLEGKIDVEEPEILSRRDRKYFEEHARHLTMSDVKSLCEILQYPVSEIFTDRHIREINGYGFLTLDGKEYMVGSSRVQGILLEINADRLNKNDVLHDTSKLLGKHKPDELKLKVEVYNHLINQGYMHSNVSQDIIRRLKAASTYSLRKPDECIAALGLERLEKKIMNLGYDGFLRVLDYVRSSNLPPNFKQELEREYTARREGRAKN